MDWFLITYYICAIACIAVCIASIFSKPVSNRLAIYDIEDFFMYLIVAISPVANIIMFGGLLLIAASYYKPKHWKD